MLPFFRKIRYKLANDNQFFKYSRYAIGEIVLVVIGILIALQINTLVQDKQDRAFELRMLYNIRNDLYLDMQFAEYLIVRAKNSHHASEYLMEIYGSDNDSLVLLAYPTMTMGMSFDYRKGAYEALKSTGLDKISNDSIREILTSIYDFGKPRMFRWINRLETYKEEQVEMLEDALFAPQIVIDSSGKKEIIVGIKQSGLSKDKRLLQLIGIYQFRAKEEIRRLESMIENSKFSLSQLNRELEDIYPFSPEEKEKIETIGILGSATEGGWEIDTDLTKTNQNDIFQVETTLRAGEVKFRANDKWTINWGGFNYPTGYGVQDGNNISVKPGRYRITLNIKNGFYEFEKIDDI